MRVFLGLFAALAASIITSAAEVRVFAAASLTDALKEIAVAYEKDSGDKIVFNFGASNFLARQIDAGAPADVFFSADEAQMDLLEKKGLLAAKSRRDCLGNSLVIVVPSDRRSDLKSAAELKNPEFKRLALADPAGVPAGIYAKKYLKKIGFWSALSSKIVPTDNVRAALAAVEAGNADAAIVYKTDAAISRQAKVAFEIPASETPDIKYPVSLLKDARSPEAAQKLIDRLFSPMGAKTFQKFGFVTLP